MYLMTEGHLNRLKQSLLLQPKLKIINLSTEPDSDAINKSFQLESQSYNSLDNIELLHLQVNQLRRQNDFLKRKISEYNLGKSMKPYCWQKKQSLNCINVIKKNEKLKEMHKNNTDSLSLVFNEIENLLKSLASIHQLQINPQLWIHNTDRSAVQQNLQDIYHAQTVKQFKKDINKKLQMILLQQEQKKTSSLLELFHEFYSKTKQEQKRAQQRLQKFIEKTLEIVKSLIEHVRARKSQNTLKSSCIQSSKFNMDETSIRGLNVGKQNNAEFSKVRKHLQRHQITFSDVHERMAKEANRDKIFCEYKGIEYSNRA